MSSSPCDISRVAENVLHLLRGLVGDIGKSSEGRNIGEIAVVEAADVTEDRLSVSYDLCSLYLVRGDTEAL